MMHVRRAWFSEGGIDTFVVVVQVVQRRKVVSWCMFRHAWLEQAANSKQQSSFDGMESSFDGMERSLDGNNKKQQQDGSGSQVDMRKYI